MAYDGRRLVDAIKANDLRQVKQAFSFWRRLLRMSPDIHQIHDYAMAPLHYAAAVGAEDITRFLIGCGAQTHGYRGDCDPLHAAAVNGQCGTAKILLDHGAPIDGKAFGSATLTGKGATPLHWAADAGQYGSVNFLVDARAPLDEPNEEGTTALVVAAQSLPNNDNDVQGKIIQRLIKGGATVDAQNQWGETALWFATKWRRPKIVKILLDSHASPDKVTKHGGDHRTARLMAEGIQTPEIVRMFNAVR